MPRPKNNRIWTISIVFIIRTSNPTILMPVPRLSSPDTDSWGQAQPSRIQQVVFCLEFISNSALGLCASSLAKVSQKSRCSRQNVAGRRKNLIKIPADFSCFRHSALRRPRFWCSTIVPPQFHRLGLALRESGRKNRKNSAFHFGASCASPRQRGDRALTSWPKESG